MPQPRSLVAQKMEVFDLEKACEQQCAALHRDRNTMSDTETEALMLTVLNDFIDQQRSAGFRVSIIPHDRPLEPTRVLCTMGNTAAPQRAVILRPWGDLTAFKRDDRATIINLQLRDELKKLNDARIVVDDMVIFETFDTSFLFLIVHDA